jgi:hypothetical protein
MVDFGYHNQTIAILPIPQPNETSLEWPHSRDRRQLGMIPERSDMRNTDERLAPD